LRVEQGVENIGQAIDAKSTTRGGKPRQAERPRSEQEIPSPDRLKRPRAEQEVASPDRLRGQEQSRWWQAQTVQRD